MKMSHRDSMDKHCLNLRVALFLTGAVMVADWASTQILEELLPHIVIHPKHFLCQENLLIPCGVNLIKDGKRNCTNIGEAVLSLIILLFFILLIFQLLTRETST